MRHFNVVNTFWFEVLMCGFEMMISDFEVISSDTELTDV